MLPHHSSHPPLPLHPWVMGKGHWAIFQNAYIGGTQVKLGFWVGIGTLGEGDFFQVGLGNSLHKKSSEYESQKKKKKDSDCNFTQIYIFSWGLIFFFRIF